MLARPQKWNAYLDRKSDNWAARKLDTLGMNKQISKWELGKSLVFKIVVALAAVANTAAVVLAVFAYRLGIGS